MNQLGQEGAPVQCKEYKSSMDQGSKKSYVLMKF